MNEGSAQGRLGPAVAEEVRALLARRRISGVQLAKQIGKSQPYFSRRLNGAVSFDLDDLEAIAKVLEINVTDLIPKERGSNRDFDLAPAGATATVGHSFVSLAKGLTIPPRRRRTTPPNSQGKSVRNRPVSAVPARKRRPRPVHLGDRAGAK
jgi:transcriptional regulator with XRE-family HTH domain